MKGTTHIVVSEEPLEDRRELTSLCGVIVHNAVFQCAWDGNEFSEQMLSNPQNWARPETSVRGLCTKCFRLAKPGRYVYGILSGEESLHE